MSELERRWLLTALVAALLVAPAHARMYKWTDHEGNVHYGDKIPPEYAQEKRKEVSGSGLVRDSAVATKPEADAESSPDLPVERSEQARRDAALLGSYASVEEIELARQRNSRQVRNQIDSFSRQLESARKELDALDGQMARIEADGGKVPAAMIKDREQVFGKVRSLETDLRQRQEALTDIDARFDADVARFRELKALDR